MLDVNAITHETISGESESYKRLEQKRDAFLAKINDGSATREDMLSFVLLINHCGYETIPQSDGMQWIRYNVEKFAEIVGDMDEFMEVVMSAYEAALSQREGEDVFRSPLLSLPNWFFQGIMRHEELMTLLSLEWREKFVRELLPRFGSTSNGWINVAIMSGVSRKVIATAIVEQLRRIKVSKNSHDVDDFIKYGSDDRGIDPKYGTLRNLGYSREFQSNAHKEFERDPEFGFRLIRLRAIRCLDSLAAGNGYTHQVEPFSMHHRTYSAREKWWYCFGDFKPWDMLTDPELTEALLICASKASTEVLRSREKMQKRLNEGTVDKIITCAVTQLKELHRVPESELERLSLEARRSLASRLEIDSDKHLMDYEIKPILRFLLRLTVDLGDTGKTFWNEVVKPFITEERIVSAFIEWRRLDLRHDKIDGSLLRQLDEAGCWFGYIQQGKIPSGKRRGQTQHYVDLHDDGRIIRYVCNRDIHRGYYPQVGEEVVFSYRRATALVHGEVYVTIMTPVMRDVRR
jgi:hypothetical protein